MEDKNKEKITEETEGGEKQSPQLIQYPILPKNIMAVVGNTPVVLGQQYILVKTIRKDSPVVSTGDIIRLNASTNSQTDPKGLKGNTNFTVGDGDRYHVATKPISLPLDPSRVLKTLVSQKVMKTSHPGSTDALMTSRSKEVSLSQSQTLESALALPLKKRSLLFNDKHQCLSQGSLLADEPFAPECGNSESTSSASKLSTDQFVLISKPEKTEAVVDLNSINANQRQEVTSSKPQGVPSFIVNLPESSGDLGSAKTPQIGDINTKYLENAHLSPHDKKIRTIIPADTVAYQAQSPAHPLKLIAPQGSAILSGIGQSMVIGNIASLSHYTPSQLLSATVPNVKKPFIAGNEKGIDSVPNQSSSSLLSFPRPTNDTPVKHFSPQVCSALKSMLSSSVSSNPSVLSYSVPVVPRIGFPSSSSSSICTDGGKTTPIIKTTGIEDEDPETRQCSANIIDYYTSLENHDQGQQVMVIKPVLESDTDCDENSIVTFQSQGHDTKGKHTLSHVNGNHSLTCSSQGGEWPHETVKDDNQCNDAPLNLKIQSVFSLADSLPDFESPNYDDSMKNALETEICNMSEETDTADSEDFETDSETEEETTFNLHEKEWKKVCPMSFVVLERLTPQDIEDKREGRTKLSVRCSHHCRTRTLSYMCDLKLLNCENPSHFKDATSNKKTDIYTTLSSANDEEVKETDSEASPSKSRKQGGVTTSPLYLKRDGNDKQNNQCEQPAQLYKDENQNQTELKIESCQALERETDIHCKHTLIASEIESNLLTGASSLSKPEVSSLTIEIEKEEQEQVKEDLISLKRRIEEQRLRMKLQKTQRSLSGKMKNTALAPAKAQSEGTIENLPSMSRSLKKLQETSPSQKNPIKLLIANVSPSTPTTKAYQSSKESSTVTTSSRAIPVCYVMDCSAPSLFSRFKSRVPKRMPTPTSPLILKKAQRPSSPQGNVSKALKTVFSTLKSLADHFKATDHVPKGSQYVMSKIDNTPFLFKVSPANLLPENLDALEQASQGTSSQLKKQQTKKSQLSTAVPHVSSASASKPNSSRQTRQTRQQQRPSSPIYLSYAEAVACKQKSASSKRKTSSASKKLPIKTQSLTSTSSHVSSSSSPTTITSSSQSISSKQKKQGTNVPYSGSVPCRTVNSRKSKANFSTSNRSLHSLLTTDLSTCKNISNLTHFPITSSLLPERQLKTPRGFLSEEERATKRRKLEQKYPLPPGVIIKSEPDTSEYELDSNWSVTSDIQTDYLNSSEMANMEIGNCPMTVKNASGRSCTILGENQHNVSPGAANAEENVDDANSPPHLDSVHSYQIDEHSGMSSSPIEIENDEEPPLLEPMPSTSFQQITSEANKALNKMSATQLYDSGYDSVGPSSSAESIESQQTIHKQPFAKMSKIQHLKELLKVRQLQVENMLKKRSEIPEVDLNAL